mmetsp:Transcript_39022/g.103132  ORF Transcript_39022/g.103132 Transcript_39022/m.103132 type:complete len:371 (-) Transcript_39022:41-1153(-)
MGSCVGKGAKSQEQVLERDRRGLSSKAEVEANNGPPMPAATAWANGRREGTVLDLLPNAHCRVSVCGVCSDALQKGFEEKVTRMVGTADGNLGNLRVGYACKKGLKPESPNQDDFCILRMDSTSIYGVFDGHGPYGHDVSGFAQEVLPWSLAQDPAFASDPVKALTAAFPATHKLCTESQTQGHFDCTLSGTTATLVMHRDQALYVAHVGDSRAVLARRRDGKLLSEDITADHKPTCEVERRRIQAAGGEVKRLDGDIPYRVFLHGKMYPGLAMTRSIGDTVGSVAGVTSEPEVRKLEVQGDWRFLLLCSDGVWEFITSQEAVDIVAGYPPAEAQKAAEMLALEAWNRWIKEEENIVDDITVVCAWFHDD